MTDSSRIMDFHVHPIPTLISIEDLLVDMDNAGVDQAVLLALDVDPKALDQKWMKDHILRCLTRLFVVDASNVIKQIKNLLQAVKTAQSWVAKLVKRYPNRFVGFGSVNPAKNDEYIEKKLLEINRLELHGIKLIPTLQFFNPEKAIKKMRRVFKFCEETDIVVLCHTGCDPYIWEYPAFSEDANPKYLERTVREFRDVPVILAHMGCYSTRYPGIWMEEALQLGKTYDNIWFDVAAVTYTLTEKSYVERIRDAVGFDRVLFGSDYPVVQGTSIKTMISDVRASPYLTDEEKAKVLGLNAFKLINE